MEQQIERWELGSGMWVRDRASDTWRLESTPDGTPVAPALATHDLARLVGARRETASGEWFPPDFNYSLQTGVPLRVNVPAMDAPWVPPFGASALSSAKPLARGLRQTLLPLALANPRGRSPKGAPDRTLPPLAPGQWRFVVDKFDAACAVLIAIEPERGELLMLLPDSKSWVALQPANSAKWAHKARNAQGWRIELVHAQRHATAYCPCANGLAAITPSAIGLCYAVDDTGDGAAIGGPVAWGGEIWLPVLGREDAVHILGKPHGADKHIVLPTRAPVPQHGFAAPVFDDSHVNWPCAEGQLVLRMGTDGEKHCDWIDWPAHSKPLFDVGCSYQSPTGRFWQLCHRDSDERFEFVQMARASPEAAPVDGPRLCTGRVSYRGTLRIDGDPWRTVPQGDESSDIVVPLIESAQDGAVIGLRMDAPAGLLALLHARTEPRPAVLQVELRGAPAVAFGTLEVERPWLALPFVYEGHLWVHHPELPQVAGWRLGA